MLRRCWVSLKARAHGLPALFLEKAHSRVQDWAARAARPRTTPFGTSRSAAGVQILPRPRVPHPAYMVFFLPGVLSEFVIRPLKSWDTGRSFILDASAVLNPFRAMRNIDRSLSQPHREVNLREGIWIGRVSTCAVPVGFSLFPGLDGFHWCVAVRGTVFNLSAVPDTNAEGHPVVHTNKSSNGRRLIYKRMTGNTLAIAITDVADESLKFEWFKLRGLCSKQICKTDDQIRTFSATLGGEGEYSLTSFNCQTVVMQIIGHAINDHPQAVRQIWETMGTALY